ncbi:F-box protein CPR30-like [Chenopodium quinoa]|uniref:F-box protein CPR30-like n=1 Tax=Chenopodium quinoa TaxID=63459 RepID=UPI000B78D991|nr:F-box protein CPR30-like [Chenopodium quinoa]
MAALPTEIITEILSRLPVKSLLRFKCVCKSWNSLIKSPNFIKLHLNQTLISNSDHHVLRWSECSSLHSAEIDLNLHHNHLYFSELNHPLETQKLYLFGSCNGVVCISDPSKNDVFLYNPLTNSHRKLPADRTTPNLIHEAVLFGFGYDSKNDDYKVLKIVQGLKFEGSFNNEAKLYSLNNHSWKCVEGIPYYVLYGDRHGVYFNEVIHFMVNYMESDSKSCKFIASFDLRTESFELMDFPSYDDKLRNPLEYLELYLKQLGGCLCLVVNYDTDNYAHMFPPGVELGNQILYRTDLWVMKEFGNKESWVKLFSICEMNIIQSCLCLRPVVYSKDGRRILMEKDYSEFAWYDLESKEVTETVSHGLPNKFFDAGFFVGSLVLLQDKQHLKRESLPVKSKRSNDSDNFLSAGFKLKL